ncbi:uncharacterized protein [Nicotiana sylvestris]|uniref:uncharacterized protein n=1 Tax=Nicotiana sylvestris TaxID=4096 RepID=UPI00388C89A0
MVNVILGMDWPSPYHAILDCHAKTVTLALVGLPHPEWRGTSGHSSSRVISYMKARRMIEKGYLAYIRDSSTEVPSMDSTPVVRKFPEVFPADLLGMPPNRDIDFCIDLAPGTQPISISPYRMTPPELKELKEQLQDFCQLSIQLAPYEALYGRRFRSPVGWFKPGEARLLGTDVVQDAMDKVKIIQDRLRTMQSRQKSYAKRKVRDVSFTVGERVFFRVSLMKGIMRFGKMGKLSPTFVGPFEILQRLGEVAYELALPPGLSAVHPVFHVSVLRKYHGDLSHVLDFSTVQLEKDLTYEEEPVAILDRQVR